MITAVIPAYNEEERIAPLLEETAPYVDELIIIDDASSDGTAEVAGGYGKVVTNQENMGYIRSIKRGFCEAEGDLVLTLDADGEHDPGFIPDLVGPIEGDEADLVFGRRERIPRPSERLISRLVRSRMGAEDTGTGFRAMKKKLAMSLPLDGYCTCGIFALEAYERGARIQEVPAPTRDIDKKKRIAWTHIPQFFVVLKMLMKTSFS